MKNRVSNIVLMGQPESMQIWEQKVTKLFNTKKVIFVKEASAIPDSSNTCIYVPGVKTDIDQLLQLIKKGMHVLVVTHPVFLLEHAETLWKVAKEAGTEIWISLWNMFRPGIPQLMERLSKPDYLFFERFVHSGDNNESRLVKQVLCEEILLALTWFGSDLKRISIRESGKSQLLHLETVSQQLLSLHVNWQLSIDKVYRSVGSNGSGRFLRRDDFAECSISHEGQEIKLPVQPDHTPANNLLIHFIRAIRGLAHTPSFKLYDLYRHRTISDYI